MDFFSTEFLASLLSIVIIDLVLAGDNAIVIGLAARNLPKENQKKVIIWGTIGAVVMRVIATVTVVWLLAVPGLLGIGGGVLLWIAYKLLVEENEHEIKAGNSVWQAIRTIIIADTVMGLDNVLAVAGVAHDNYLLVIVGLLISVPIVVWGSTLFLKLMDRFPWIIYAGSGILAWTGAKMIVDEPLLKGVFQGKELITYTFSVVCVIIILFVGYSIKQRNGKKKSTDGPAKECSSLK